MYKEMLGTRASIAIINYSCPIFLFFPCFPCAECWGSDRSVRSMAVCVGSGWCIAYPIPIQMSRYCAEEAEPTIPRVLAVFPTQRFHQPRSAAPPPTPTIVNSKPFHSRTRFRAVCGWVPQISHSNIGTVLRGHPRIAISLGVGLSPLK